MPPNCKDDYQNFNRDCERTRSWGPIDARRADFYSSFITEGCLVFDVGANLGNRTKVFRRLGATVVALEPQPYCQSVLRQVFKDDANVILVPAGAGSQEGKMRMLLSTNHVLSSFSAEWIKHVTHSGRFGSQTRWEDSIWCNVVPLRKLMLVYGIPEFIKIDVEGYEVPVIEGMQRCPSTSLSFEFTPECLDAALSCIDLLTAMGMTEFNYSSAESMKLSGSWRDSAALKAELEKITDSRSFGDVYSRLRRRQFVSIPRIS